MTDDELIDGLIAREGGYSDNPRDKGGATRYGITARDLGRWRRLGRLATRAEVAALELPETHAIYQAWYVAPLAWVGDDALRAQLVDFAVTSGVGTAVQQLQHVLDVAVDGQAGPQTQHALATLDPRLVNNALVAARVTFVARIVDRDPSQLTFLHGWVRRAVGFFA